MAKSKTTKSEAPINYLIKLPKELAIEMQEELHALRIKEIKAGGRGKATVAAFWRDAAATYLSILRAARLAS